jgi:tRNA-modifying protein YgfZ
MIEQLRKIQQEAGAILAQNGNYPETFDNDLEILNQINHKTFLYDLSHWGLIQLTGEDRIRYLHNQSTNNINNLKTGEGCETVFVTSTARTIDLVNVYLTEDSILLLVSPNRHQYVMEWLDRFIFPMDKVALKNLSGEYGIFTLWGEESDQIIESLGFNEVKNLAEYSHKIVNFENQEIRIIVGSNLKIKGYTFIVPMEIAEKLWLKLGEKGAIFTGENAWKTLRILQGRPLPDQELTEDYNPLEVGLWHTISFDKGCYIGQETIARLNTYKGVKQRLWGIKLNDKVSPEAIITLNGEKIGKLTSITQTPQGIFGLAYIRTKAGGEGLNVEVENTQGVIISVPYLSHEYYGDR